MDFATHERLERIHEMQSGEGFRRLRREKLGKRRMGTLRMSVLFTCVAIFGGIAYVDGPGAIARIASLVAGR